MARILVTPRSVTKGGHPSLDRLVAAGHEIVLGPPGRQPSELELLQLLRGCGGYLAGVEPITAKVLEASTELRVISRNGTGVDNIDLSAAAKHRIVVQHAAGANARGVAELTLALMLALVRDLPEGCASIKRGGWYRRQGIELEGKTLGILGCGRIGQFVARFAGALGMQVLAHDPFANLQFNPGAFFRFVPVHDVLVHAHVLSLHCPPPPDGSPIIERNALATMKRGAYLINTARFDLIDSRAIRDALDREQLAGLALDVFAEEPPEDRTLASHPRVICTAHIGGFTEESVNRAMHVAVDNLLASLAEPCPSH
jgi:phosphoglycerate dehydrogenase-like enzyme